MLRIHQLHAWGIACIAMLVSVVPLNAQESGNLAPPSPVGPPPEPGRVMLDDAPDERAGIAYRNVSIGEAVRPRVTLRHDFGNGVGYDSGFTWVEGYLPLMQEEESDILFGDLRIVNFDNNEFNEFNFGGGYRWYDDGVGRVMGVNGFYDMRNTADHLYHQIGLGWEVLGKCWEFRHNVYIPFGSQKHYYSDSGPINPRFEQQLIVFDRVRKFETSMGGTDLEIGRQVPMWGEFQPGMFLGYYFYDNKHVDSAHGVRGRIEAQLNQYVTAHFAVQNDRVFDTTVTGGLSFTFGGNIKKNCLCENTIASRLGQRVVRDPDVVITRDKARFREAAVDGNGTPLRVVHVDSNANAGGNGTVETPFQTLAQAEAGSNTNNIVFAHGGSVFDGENIVLKDGQRFLADGTRHTFRSVQGQFLLPSVDRTADTPAILNAPGDAVTLANNTEVSGFEIVGASQHGVAGANIMNVDINRNNIRTPGADGIALLNVSGRAVIQGNNIRDPGSAGITIVEQGATLARIDVLGNTIKNPAGTMQQGLAVAVQDDANVRMNISNNKIYGAGDNAIALLTSDNAHLKTDILNNNLNGTDTGPLLNIFAFDDSRQIHFIQRNTFRNSADDGAMFTQFDTSRIDAQIVSNKFRNIAETDIDIVLNEMSFGKYQLAFNSLLGNDMTDAAVLTTNDTAKLTTQIFGNTANGDINLVQNGGLIRYEENNYFPPGSNGVAFPVSGTNMFQGGAMFNAGAATPEDFGFAGFPAPAPGPLP